MSEYQKLQDEFDRKVKELQENCDHTEFGDEQDEYWAIAHTTGARVKYCKRCWHKIYINGDPEIMAELSKKNDLYVLGKENNDK